MKTLLIIVALGLIIAIGFFAQRSVPGEALHTVETAVVEEIESVAAFGDAAEAQLQAELFAERIEEAVRLDNENKLTLQSAEQLRETIGEQFDVTFELIKAVEADADLAEASTARAIMQTAIEYRMNSGTVLSEYINDDLEVYSRLLTESLIDAAVEN
ncbi:hypothetical protein N9L26_01915 [Candidatus Pacebacteria bacterium]|nr:hypothetical protein [Candidatus Paceibacterota bacterium]